MNVCILRGPRAEQSVIDSAIAALKARGVEGWEARRDGPEDTISAGLKGTALIVTLGGDGTFLAGGRLAAPKGIPVLGVNLGRLGFLTEVEADQLENGLTRFLDGKYVAKAIGLNEVVLDHSGEARMLRVEIDVGGQAVGIIDADGVMVSTATGSTAYALASGGPILEPSLRDLVLVPMNPFALTVRPIVFPPGQNISLSVVRGPGEMRIDGGSGQEVQTGDTVRCGSHPRRLKVVRFSPPEEFYRRLGNKLGWGRPLVPNK